MAASLNTLPTETQIQIFRLLVPTDPYEPRRTDLGHLRLTCKSILSSANELYFEHYYCLLWMKDGAFVESRSLQLLRDRPEYAALVKTTWIALAISDPHWLRIMAAFASVSALSEENTLKGALTQISWFEKSKFCHDSDDSEPDLPDPTLTYSETETVRRYHRRYIAQPAYEQEYSTPSTIQVQEELKKRVALLPNVRQIRLERPPFVQTPFYTERLNFWIASGFGERAKCLSGLCGPGFSGLFEYRRFPWWPCLIEAGLATLPQSCKQLQMDIRLFGSCSQVGNFLQTQVEQSTYLRTQLESLHLLIDSDYMGPWSPENVDPDVTNFTNNLRVLTRLELRGNIEPRTVQHATLETMKSVSPLLLQFSLPQLRYLGISRLSLKLDGFDRTVIRFPNLKRLRVEEVTIQSPEVNAVSKNLWYRLAKHIRNEFGGDCVLQFKETTFVEINRSVYGYIHELPEPDPAMRVLKTPILEVLTSISQSKATSTELDEKYWGLVAHEKPNLPEHSLLLNRWGWTFTSLLKEIETPGMKFMYFDRYS